MRTKITLIYVIVFLLKTVPSFSNKITALSCSQTHVQIAINAALDGDTVIVPAGTATWTQSLIVDLTVGNRALTIRGAGIGQTIIYDSIPRTSPLKGHVINITTSSNKPFRLKDFTFMSTTISGTSFEGYIKIAGSSKCFRIDHNQFLTGANVGRAILANGFLFGVIDHNIFITSGQAITIHHYEWGGGSNLFGDGSWADSLTLGSDRAIFIEDNYLQKPALEYGAVIDAFSGARYVVRNNKIIDARIANHGTETSQRMRSAFSWEVYNNTFSLLNHVFEGNAMHLRGGTGVVFNNNMVYTVSTIGNSGYSSLLALNNYRNNDTYPPFGACDGSSSWDKNYTNSTGNSIVYQSGLHTGITVTTGVLTDATKTWSVNQWVGYSLRNVTKNWGSQITLNSANTISITPSTFGNLRKWDPNDVYEILQVEAGIDQIGRSTGNLLSGATPSPAIWPNQKLEPVYIWGNKKNNLPFDSALSTAYVIKKNREYYISKSRPSYIPYTYPHPLTLCGYTSDSTKAPILTGFGISSSVVCQAQKNVVYGVSANISSGFSWSYSGAGVTINNGSANIKSLNFSSSATSGTLSVFASSACGLSNVLSIPINVNLSPTLTVNNSVICSGQTATLNASGANTYSWSNGSTSSSIVISPTITTTYTLSGLTINNCSGSAIITQNVSNCTDIVNLSGVEASAINVYPNPTNGVINYELGIMSGASEASASAVQIQILNELGQIVMEEIVTTHHSSLIIHHLVNGMYFVKIIRGGISQTVKIIKD